MKKDERARDRLEHILAAIEGIERLTNGRTLADHSADPDRVAAVERYFERLSEASRHLPSALTERYPNIPWRPIADLGNVLRHAYDQIANERIWHIVEHDLETLKRAVMSMLASTTDPTG